MHPGLGSDTPPPTSLLFFFSQHRLISQVIFIFAWEEMIRGIPGSAVTHHR